MANDKIQILLEFKKIVSIINKELEYKEKYTCEYLLINSSVEDVIRMLEKESDYYQYVKDIYDDRGISFNLLLEKYFILVKQYYDSLLIKEGSNDRVADKYHSKILEPTSRTNRETGEKEYIQYDKSNIHMVQTEVEKTLQLMKEAVEVYYKAYHKRILVAELSTRDPEISTEMEFQIKENNLLHLLGVTIEQLRNNPDFQRLTGRREMKWQEILDWILRDIDGNNDLLQYNEDFLKKIYESRKYKSAIAKDQFGSETTTQILNYGKIRSKSQTFLKYGPLDSVSLVAKLTNGTLSRNSKSDSAMITRAETFRKYPWAYFGRVEKGKDSYIETLQIDDSEHKKELFKYAKPAIIKGIRIDTSSSTGGGSGGCGAMPIIFDEEKQFELFSQAYEAFSETMDFSDLIEYFSNLAELNNPRGRNR